MSLIDRTGQLRVGDTEREAAVAALGEHYAAGRLTLEEYDDRTTRAFGACVAADLWPLFRDLPQMPAPRERRRRGWRGPGFAPLLLVVIGLGMLTDLPWPILLLVGWVLWSRVFRRWSRADGASACVGYSSGSRRAVRGTWS